MDDLISRQTAIAETEKYKIHSGIQNQGTWNECVSTILETLRELPSAEPQERKGKWIDAVIPNDNGGLPVQVCDQCNTFFPLAYTGGGHHFCPNCGAKMEVDNEQN